MLSMSSITVIIKVLGELGKMKERFAHLIFGILILEDMLGIAMIALRSGIAMTGASSLIRSKTRNGGHFKGSVWA